MFARVTVWVVLAFCFCYQRCFADEVVHRYEAQTLPYDPSAGWSVSDPCDNPCNESVENGHFVLRWAAGGNQANYFLRIAGPSDPLPASLWVEWHFRSNHPLGINFYTCDAHFIVGYANVFDLINMYGDAVASFTGGAIRRDLNINKFHTFRFESLNGVNYRFHVDGQAFIIGTENTPSSFRVLQFGGLGGCDTTRPPTVVNEWDFVRYGTIGSGEQIVGSDPPAGVVDASQFPNFNRFTITFDQPNYVVISEITVSVSGGPVPQVVQTRRRDPPDPLQVDDDPRIVEIVLDRPLTVGETTTFTFNDGTATNVVEYTLLNPAACCLPNGSCEQTIEPDCAGQGGTFLANAACTASRACCSTTGSCSALDPLCCGLAGGSSQAVNVCEGDADTDGVDAACGDPCPADAANDKDADGLCADVDPCPNLNPDDSDGNGIPDCQKPAEIPALSLWGVVILALALSALAKLRYGRRSSGSVTV